MSQAGSAAAAGVVGVAGVAGPAGVAGAAGDEQVAATAPIPVGDTPTASAGDIPAASASPDPANRAKQASTVPLDSERRDPVEAVSLEAAAKSGDVGIRHPIVPCGGLKSAAHSIPEADIPVLSSMGSTFGAFTAGTVPQDGLFLPTLPQVRVDFPPGHLVRTTSQDSSVAATLGSPTGSIMSLDQFSTCSSIPPYHMSPAPSFTSDQAMADLAGSGLVTSRLGITSKALFSSPGEKSAGGQSAGVAEREAGGSRFGGAGASYPAPPTVQTLVVVRHAEPIDEQDDGWAAGSDRPWDPPLSARGAKAAEEVGQALRARGFGAGRSSARGGGGGKESESGDEVEGARSGAVVRVVVSPFRRCVQTAVHVVAGLLGARTGEGAEGEKGEGEKGEAGSAGEGKVAGGAAEGSQKAEGQVQSAASPSGVTVTVSISPALAEVSFSPALAEVMNTRALRRCTEERPPAASIPLSSMAEHAGLAAAVEAAAAEARSKGWVLGEDDLKALFTPGTTFLPLPAAAAAASGDGRAGRNVHSEFPIFPESLESARERFMQAFDDVAALFPSDSILCVTHGDAVAASVERLAPVTVVAVDFCGYSWSQRRAAPLYTHPSRLHHDSHHSHHHASLPPLPPPPPPPPTPANEPESLDGEEAGVVGSRQTVSASFAAAVVAAGSETEAAAVAAAAVAAVAGLQASRRGGLGGVVEEGEEEGEGEEGGDGSDGRSGGKQGALSDSVVIVGGSTASDISTHEGEEDDKDTVNSSIDVGPSLSEVAEGDEEGEERGAGEEGEEVGSESGQEGLGGRGRGEARMGGGMEVGEWELLTSSGSTGVCWISNIALAARDDETPTKGLAS
ncbi:unnamed protein product [Closterium sp. Naga37s-1]|nr:unnamed protein product [Closterium sp. Naga37s-1]